MPSMASLPICLKIWRFVLKNDGEIFFTTNMDGARVIVNEIDTDDNSMPLYIFGDSQILGIDWSDNNEKLKHDITMEFPDRSM